MTKILKNKKLYAFIVIMALALSMAVGAFQFNNKTTASAVETGTYAVTYERYDATIKVSFPTSTIVVEVPFNCDWDDSNGIWGGGELHGDASLLGGNWDIDFNCEFDLSKGYSSSNAGVFNKISPEDSFTATTGDVSIFTFYVPGFINQFKDVGMISGDKINLGFVISIGDKFTQVYKVASVSGKFTYFELPDNPTKEGHTFKGWYTDSNFNTLYTGQPVTSDITLYAKFDINRYTISYVINGGSSVGTQTVDWSTTISNPTTTREGYTFGGWYTDSGFSNQFNFSTPIKQNYTLYAKWNINRYTINFVSNGGSSVDSETVDWDTTISNPPIDRIGYTFGGWYTDSGFINQFNFSTPIKQNYTFYAKWTINRYTVNFVINGGTAVNSQTVDYNTKLSAVTISRTGYNFLGWFSDDKFASAFSIDSLITKDYTLYAKWELKTYTVTFIVDGEVAKKITVEHGTILETLNQEKEVKKAFSALFLDANMTEFDGSVMITDELTLYGVKKPTAWDNLSGFVKDNTAAAGFSGFALMAILGVVIFLIVKGRRANG